MAGRNNYWFIFAEVCQARYSTTRFSTPKLQRQCFKDSASKTVRIDEDPWIDIFLNIKDGAPPVPPSEGKIFGSRSAWLATRRAEWVEVPTQRSRLGYFGCLSWSAKAFTGRDSFSYTEYLDHHPRAITTLCLLFWLGFAAATYRPPNQGRKVLNIRTRTTRPLITSQIGWTYPIPRVRSRHGFTAVSGKTWDLGDPPRYLQI